MMKKKRRSRTIILCSCAGVLIALFCIRVYSLNRRFPPTTVKHYACGESVNLDAKSKYTDEKTVENAFKITVSDFKVCNTAELIEEFQLKDSDIPYEKKRLIFKVSVKNISKTEQVLELYNVNIQCSRLGWLSSVNLNWFKAVNAYNPKMSLQPLIKVGETITLFLPYSIDDEHFANCDFNKINQENFDLVLSLYPKKKLINLNY